MKLSCLLVAGIVSTSGVQSFCLAGGTPPAFYTIVNPGPQFTSDVSTDGSIVFGHRQVTSLGYAPFGWTISDGSSLLLHGGAPFEAITYGASGDGQAVVGRSLDQAFRWTSAGGRQFLGFVHPQPAATVAYAASYDGSVVVGNGVPVVVGGSNNTRAFRWTESGGIQALGALPGGSISDATDISADGSVIVGHARSSNMVPRAARWMSGSGWQALPLLPNATGNGTSFAEAISGDGQVVVGVAQTANGDREAWRWTQADGIASLGNIVGATYGMTVTDTSFDGSVVVGTTHLTWGDRAFIWTQASGMRLIDEMLVQDFGINLNGAELSSVSAISGDGTVLAGNGWVAVIPAPPVASAAIVFFVLAGGRRRH